MHEECCSNAGPFIHLHEIGQLETLNIYKKIYVPDIVFREATLPGRANRRKLESLCILFIQKVPSKTVANSGIGEGEGVDLRGNLLNDEAYDVHIPALQERGVKLLFDPKP